MLKNRQELEEILLEIEKLFPNASCELVYHNLYELLIAVMLSAQTTDKSVNLVTPNLFMKYPTALSLSNAEYDDVKSIIARLGLSSNKAKNIIATSKMLVEKYNCEVPSTLEELITLPGVGRKTANVVLSEGYKIPRIAVDTHVERVSKRLGIVSDSASVLDVEQTLMKLIDEPLWHKSHHLLLFFGRYFCLSQNPKCSECQLTQFCNYKNK
jgi:endonuclease-3